MPPRPTRIHSKRLSLPKLSVADLVQLSSHSFVKEGLVVVVRQLRLPVPGRIEVDPVLGLRDGDLEGLGPSEAVPVLSGAIVSEETIADWPDHTR